MRRWAAGILAAMGILCVGCTPKTQTLPSTADLTCAFTATYRDLQVAGELKRYGAGTLSLTFTEPETLRDVTAVWNGEEVTLSMYGLSFSADPNAIPESALGQEMVAVLDGALRGEGTCREQNGKLIFEGSTEVGDYTLTCDGESGKPLSLSIPALPLDATFTYP